MFLLNNFLFTNIVYKAIAFSFCLIITVQNVFGVYINDTRNLFKRQQLEEYRVCTSNFVIYQERIIRTEESKKSGAKYLSGKDVTSKEECIKFCCKTPNCDVFVLEEKVFNQLQGTCYLFECGVMDNLKCKFTRHHNYSSAVLIINRPQMQLENEIQYTQHERELTNLRTTENNTKSKNCDSHAKGNISGVDVTNELNFIEDTSELTKSVDERFDKSFKKNSKCSRYQFQCRSSGECIAIYNICNGIPQCRDGSDEGIELGCPTNGPLVPKKAENTPLTIEKHANIDTSSNENLPENFIKPFNGLYGDKNIVDMVQVMPPINQHLMNGESLIGGPPKINGEGNMEFDDYDGNGNVGNTWHSKSGLNNNFGLKNIDMYRNKGNSTYFYRENIPLHKTHGNVTRTTKSSNEYKSVSTESSNFTENSIIKLTTHNSKQSVYNDSIMTNTKKDAHDEVVETQTAENLNEEPNLYRKLEKKHDVEISDIVEQYLDRNNVEYGYTQQPTGAFVSLTIGLCVTGIMIFVIGVRLKIIRKRIRRGGKIPYAHDADFLVNGMYL
ncbi:hypothetical protein PGB90_008678 [Kerria lacca]